MKEIIASARAAQRGWAEVPLRSRLEVVRRLRHQLAEMPASWPA